MIVHRHDFGASSRTARWRVALVAAALVLPLVAAAAPVAFGSRTIEVPNPQGFEPLSPTAPLYVQASQTFLPPSNHLIEAYASPADRAKLAKQEPIELRRYFQLQTLRKVEGVAISSKDFADASGQMEEALKKAFADLSGTADGLARQGNAQIKQMTGTDPNVAISDVGFLGTYRREPWGMFFSISSRVSAGAGAHDKLVGSGAFALIDHQIVYLYAYSRFDGAADRTWTESAVSDWADALHAANPDDAALEAKAQPIREGINFGHIGRNVLIGALGGALIGMLGYLLRRR